MCYIWKKLFTSEIEGYLNQEFSYVMSSNQPQLMMFIYSLESWMPYLLNTTSRSKDINRVSTLAPFAYALMSIINITEYRDRKLEVGYFNTKEFTKLFRGFKLDNEEI